jgi:hypothetical protein
VDRRLSRSIAGHEIKTVGEMGWAGFKNGELLTRASGHFDVFVTVDQNLVFQQNIEGFPTRVVVLQVKGNRLANLLPLVPNLLAALDSARPGAVTIVSE